MSEKRQLRKEADTPVQVLLESSPGVNSAVCPWGATKRFENEFLEGTIFFAHTPPAGSSVQFKHADLLAARGAPVPLWELQVQARLKMVPDGPLFVGGELREKPMELGLVTRSVCTVILKFLGSLAKQRGHELRHSFGNKSGEMSMLAYPLTGADRIYISDEPVPLPILGSAEKGAWKLQDGDWVSVEKSSVILDTQGYTTFLFATSRFDLACWQARGIPGIGSFALERFFGNQPLHVVCFDESGPEKLKRYWFHIVIVLSKDAHHDVEASQTATADLKQAARSFPVETPLECSEANNDNVEDEQQDKQDEKVSAKEDDRLESLVQEAAVEQSHVGQESINERPKVGERVQIVATGRCGDLILDDGSDLPYKVVFHDGLLPAADWFPEKAVVPDGGARPGSPDSGQSDTTAKPTSLPTAAEDGLEALAAPAVERGVEALTTPAVEDGLEALTFKLDTAMIPKTAIDDTKSSMTSLLPPSVPWYFRSVAGAVWWGIAMANQLRWRPHAHIQALCETLMPAALFYLQDAALGVSADDLEYARRLVEEMMIKGQKIPGMLEEFLRDEMELSTLLNSSSAPPPWESVALVEAEGCMFELPMVLMTERLLCYHPVLGKVLAFNLNGASVEFKTVAGSPALLLATPTRQHMLILRNEVMARDWASRLEVIKSFAPAPGHDAFVNVLTRWERHRWVLNDSCLCLAPPEDALALSAEVLQLALKAHESRATSDLQVLKQRSCALKCIDLSYLPPQSIWGFWVNIFHALLLHAPIVGKLPSGLSQTVDFYNRNCYVVAGHIFSLVEIEHSILRCRLSRPHQLLHRFVLKVWKRSEEDLEQRPCIGAPWCPAEAFRCRPDWRLNLVLSAGNCSSSDALPIFQACSQKKFDALISRSMEHSLGCGGQVGESRIELPYTLYRYRDDAPPGEAREPTEMRWARALWPDKELGSIKVLYARNYDWTMRQKLRAL